METKAKTTQEVIMEQLLENTGRVLVDSGDYYGRGWQRNQGKTWEDFTKEPVKLEAYAYTSGEGHTTLQLSGWVSLASYMDANLEYDPELQEMYETWCEKTGEDDTKAFAATLDPNWKSAYTYNYDNDLSQDIAFVEFEYTGKDGYGHEAVMLVVHGGCDARWGFTKPKAYRVTSESGSFGCCQITEYGCGSQQWESNGSPSESSGGNLFEYPVFEVVYESTLAKDLEALKQTNRDNKETRDLMIETDRLIERRMFAEVCERRDEEEETACIVVYKGDAYFVCAGEPEKIYAECWDLYH